MNAESSTDCTKRRGTRLPRTIAIVIVIVTSVVTTILLKILAK